jgi:hypothetical protein
MPSPQSASSPLARLARFIVCLAIAAGIVAGLHYFVIDLPATSLHPPANGAVGGGFQCPPAGYSHFSCEDWITEMFFGGVQQDPGNILYSSYVNRCHQEC